MSLSSTTESPIPSLHVVLDFDGTITKEDTTSVLADIALAHQSTLGKNKHQEWAQILESYTTSLATHNQNFANQSPGSLERNPSQLACLSSLKAIEHASIIRINCSRIFQGLSPSLLSHGANEALSKRKVSVRPGFREFVEKVRNEGGKVGILSVNWCGDWIRGVLDAVGVDIGDGSAWGGITIMSNQIDYSTGEILGPDPSLGRPPAPPEKAKSETPKKTLPLITTADEKLTAIKYLQLRTQYPFPLSSQTQPQPQPPRTRTHLIYIADSPTDLDALLVADIAIVMVSASTPPLRAELERMGYEWSFIGEFRREILFGEWLERRIKGEGSMDKGREKVVFWAEEFNEILGSGLIG